MKKWRIQSNIGNENSDQQYFAILEDSDYEFESNISMNFISIELPTHHSKINTDILSDYYDDIVSYLNDVIDSNLYYNQVLELDSDDVKLSRDSSNNYNKFGLIHNLYLPSITSKNFFIYIKR